MDVIIICLAALAASCLTFFSGFGLGTLLLPAFTLFFPVEVAVALTAIVHFLNNLFKISLIGRHTDTRTLWRFGLPAILSALAGAYLLSRISHASPLAEYTLAGKGFQITPVKLTVAVLMIGFALLDLVPRLQRIQFDAKYLPLGGLMSGFFGGFSGHQGALRSAFLIKSGLSKEAFIATGVAISFCIDIPRLGIYFSENPTLVSRRHLPILTLATLSAFIGAYAGSKFLIKATVRSIQTIVGSLLFALALLLGVGIL